jgi:hypothetical protein
MSDENLEQEVIECAHCNEVIEDIGTRVDTDDGDVCQECSSEYYVCEECDDRVHQDNGSTDCQGDFFCQSCYDDLPYCERCEETERGMELSEVQSGRSIQMWCESCRDDNAFWCERCETTYSDYHENYYVSGSTMCHSCFEHTGAFECRVCCNYHGDEYLHNPDDDSEDWICTRCANGGHDIIHSYGYKPFVRFLKLENDKPTDLFFGIELEVEKDNSSVKHGDMAKEILNTDVYYFKRDGSLNDGFEIVTHPMTFNYIQANKDKVFLPMLNKLVEAQYRSYDANSCGIHIHLSKQAFGTWQLYRFIKFFVDNKDFVTSISQRKAEKLERWAAIDDENDDSIIYKAKKKSGNNKRYVAVNLQNSHTVEIRIFRGTLNYMSFLKNIEFCYALFNFTRDSKETTVDAFKDYVSMSNEYAMLKKFIKLKNL